MAAIEDGNPALPDGPESDAAATESTGSGSSGGPAEAVETAPGKPRTGTRAAPRKAPAKTTPAAAGTPPGRVEIDSPTTFLPAAKPADTAASTSAVGVPGRHRGDGTPAGADAEPDRDEPAFSRFARSTFRSQDRDERDSAKQADRDERDAAKQADRDARAEAAAAEKAAKERAAQAEKAAKAEAAAADKSARERAAAEAKAEKERASAEAKAEKERASAEAKAQKDRAAADAKADKERASTEARAQKERAAAEAKAAKQAAAEAEKAGRAAAEKAAHEAREAAARAKKEARVAAAQAKKDEKAAGRLAAQEARATARRDKKAARINRKLRARDLRPSPFPVISAIDWERPPEALTALFTRAENASLEAIDWYLRHKRSRKRASRLLRALSILLVAVGVMVPLLTPVVSRLRAEYGFVLLALAAACIAFDHFFGLSSGWMRDMVTAQALQRRLEVLRYDWAAETARSALTTRRQVEEVDRQLTLLREFSEDIVALTSSETSEWISEFQTSLAGVQKRATATASRAAAVRRAAAAATQEGTSRVS